MYLQAAFRSIHLIGQSRSIFREPPLMHFFEIAAAPEPQFGLNVNGNSGNGRRSATNNRTRYTNGKTRALNKIFSTRRVCRPLLPTQALVDWCRYQLSVVSSMTPYVIYIYVWMCSAHLRRGGRRRAIVNSSMLQRQQYLCRAISARQHLKSSECSFCKVSTPGRAFSGTMAWPRRRPLWLMWPTCWPTATSLGYPIKTKAVAVASPIQHRLTVLARLSWRRACRDAVSMTGSGRGVVAQNIADVRVKMLFLILHRLFAGRRKRTPRTRRAKLIKASIGRINEINERIASASTKRSSTGCSCCTDTVRVSWWRCACDNSYECWKHVTSGRDERWRSIAKNRICH